MTVVAVTGARSPLGAAVCAALADDEGVERVIGIDVAEPDMPAGKLEFRRADVRDPVLAQAIEGADVLVHLATWVLEPLPEELRLARVVRGTRNVLSAADSAGVSALVHLSSAMVYGADSRNEVPLDEGADRHVPPDAPGPYHLLLAEELTLAFAERRPDVRVATLRPATTLGEGLDAPVTKLLEQARIPMVAGYAPTFQVLDVGDLARALRLAALSGLEGAYNVAPDGWVTTAEAATLLGRRPVRVPEAPLMGALVVARRLGLTRMTPGLMAYLMHPWVVDTTRIRDAGWRAERSNREVLRAFADEHGRWLRVGRIRLRRRDLRGLAVLAAAATGGLAWSIVRRRNEREA